jgi:exonuclease SbcC
MLESLKIKRFQSHVKSQLNFSSGVNCIIGPTDSGKSAIIRALKWIITNKPSGDDFINGNDCFVSVKVQEGDEIARMKGKTINEYHLNDSIFRAFGTETPDEIKHVLNFSDFNFQSQLDSPFLLTESSGAVAAFFNKIAKLDKIDTGLSNAQKEINSLNQEIKFQKNQILQKREQLKEFDYLEPLENKVDEYEKINQTYEKTIQTQLNLIEMTNKIDELIISQTELIHITQLEPAVHSLLNNIHNLQSKKDSRQKIYDLCMEIYNCSQSIKTQSKIITLNTKVNNLLLIHEKHKNHLISRNKIQILYKDITEVISARETQEKRLKNLEQEFHKLFPNICPLCNTRLK